MKRSLSVQDIGEAIVRSALTHHKTVRRILPGLLLTGFLVSCTPDFSRLILPAGDIRPPSILAAGQKNSSTFEVEFDEQIQPVECAFSFTPGVTVTQPVAQGSTLNVRLVPEVQAGIDCRLGGEVLDGSGNATHFIFSFVGYNPNPAVLKINEVQTGKNSAVSNRHRDYIEFFAEKEGNLGGMQVRWASTVREMEYGFPPCAVQAGTCIVLHCAPEGLPEERDETGIETNLSGGVDSSAEGRDFWTQAGGLPDETGIITLRPRDQSAPIDCFFYSSESRTGEMDSSKITAALDECGEEGIWECSAPFLWEDAFMWKSTSSRSIFRVSRSAQGSDAWELGDPGSQSPGRDK